MSDLTEVILTLLSLAITAVVVALASIVWNVARPSPASRNFALVVAVALLAFGLRMAPQTIERVAAVHPSEGHRWGELLLIAVPWALSAANVAATVPAARRWIAAHRASLITLVAALALLALAMRSIAHVGAERVGLLVSPRGVEAREGWVFLRPLSERLEQLPLAVQHVRWTASAEPDTSIVITSSDGRAFALDVEVDVHLERLEAARFYQRFRTPNVEAIVRSYLRGVVREALVAEASERAAQSLVDAGGAALGAAALPTVRARAAEAGLVVDAMTIVGPLRLGAR